MKKRFFYALIACIVAVSQMAVQAEIPVVPSTDTGAGANWYGIKNVRHASGTDPAYIKAVALEQNIGTAHNDESDNMLWCFIGNETDGFQIYNKAFLENGTRLIAISGGNGFIQLADADTEWDFTWEFVAAGDVYSLRTEGVDRYPNVFHGWQNAPNFNIIFYGSGPGEGGSAWEFVKAEEMTLIDFSALTTLITDYTTQVESDKEQEGYVDKYGEGITVFEAAIAAAQAVVDDPATTEQGDINAAVIVLKKARYNYHLALIDLPFTLSEGENWVWYRIKNVRLDANGYWACNSGVVAATAAANDDNQLWAFKGDNFTGIQIYNKANMEDGAQLVAPGGSFSVSAEAWEGVWKMDQRLIEGVDQYGICNINGNYVGDYSIINDFIHTYNSGTYGLVYYGLTGGSFYIFEEDTPIVEPALPIIPSTDTGEGANWYRVKNVRAADGERGAYMKAVDYNAAVIMADVDEKDDAFLWCFVGNEEDGFQIYNKAFLDDDAKLVGVDGDNGIAKLATADTEWEHSWEFKIEGDLFGLLPSSTHNNCLHGTLDDGVLFYGYAPSTDGCAWEFEKVDISVVKPELPIISSTDTESGANWYRVKNVRAADNGKDAYMKAVTLGDDIGMAGIEEEDDFFEMEDYANYLWCFVGNETDGFQVYNKAFLEDGARLVATGDPWPGFIRLEAEDTEWDYSWEFVTEDDLSGLRTEGAGDRSNEGGKINLLHGWTDDSNLRVIFYGFSPKDDGCAWEFEKVDLPVVKPELPIIPSTDTGEAANWYRVKNVRAVAQEKDAYMKAVALGADIGMAGIDEDNFFELEDYANYLWCFVGNETDGFQVYNKAFLEDGARLVAIGDPWPGFIRLETEDTEWDYSWEFMNEDDLFGLRTEGAGARSNEDGNINLLHGWLDDANLRVIFYGYTPSADGNACAWEFEKVDLPVVLPELPIIPSTDTGEGANWYRIKSLRDVRNNEAVYMKAAGVGVDIEMADPDNSDNFVWCFIGSQEEGFQIYNKAFLDNGTRLIPYLAGYNGYGTAILATAATEWNYHWNIVIEEDGLYGLNTNGEDRSQELLHALQLPDPAIIFYGDLPSIDGNACAWAFEEYIPTSIEKVSEGAIVVYAQDGKIYLKGTESRASLYSVSGGLIAVFDAQTPFAVAKGIYIVQIDGKAYKVAVR